MKNRYWFITACIACFVLACTTSKRENTVSESIELSSIEPMPASEEVTSSELRSIAEVEDMADLSEPARYSDQNQGHRAKAHLLTATEINDFKKWDEWQELIKGEFASYKGVWNIVPGQRFVARVSDDSQRPVADAVVKLYDATNKLVWIARTDNTGTAQLWSDAFLASNNQNTKAKSPFKIVFSLANEQKTIENAQPYPQQTNVVRFNNVKRKSDNVDIFFIVDATGSMSDELEFLQAELYTIIDKVKKDQSNLNIRMGALVYRDNDDDYVTRKSSLNTDIDKTVGFLKKQYAEGGGDTPEAVDEALYQAIEQEVWVESALARIAFLILDAPPHNNPRSIRRVNEQIALAASKGIRLVPLVASGMSQDGEYLMRSMALTTNGTYIALTDDSGIGNSHAKPTTDYYKVEKLNDLLIRLINDYTRIPKTI